MKDILIKEAESWIAWINDCSGRSDLIPEPKSVEAKDGLFWSPDLGPLVGELPPGLYTIDLETCNLGEYWVPYCAAIYDWQEGTYWHWVAPSIRGFIDLPIAKGSVLIGHNICGYDRQFFSPEYCLDPPYEYVDTMGLAQRIRGISNQQVPSYRLGKGDWVSEHKGSSLAGLCDFYLSIKVDKTIRSEISGKPWSYYVENGPEILNYCANDVYLTSMLFKKLWTETLDSFHPISVRSMGLLSKSRLPIDTTDLKAYISKVSDYYETDTASVSDLLDLALEKAVTTYVEPWVQGQITLEDLPVSYQYLDWTPARSGKTKGYPLWYRKVRKVTLSGHLAPILLGVKYQGHLVYWANGSWSANGSKIPHPEGKGNLGQIFNKHYWDLLGDQITTDDAQSHSTLKRIKNLQFWKAFQGRVKNALRFTLNGVHIPDYKPWGTVSGRGSDSLWLVSPSPNPDSPGSELRTLVKSPKGYKVVGADYASQEMRIFALLGDSAKGRLGSSDLSRLLLGSGDIHTALSERSGAPRRVCKNINYGAIYGLGLSSAETYCRLAKMPNPRKTAQTVLDSLRGSRLPNGYFSGGLASSSFNYVRELMDKPRDATSPILGNKISKALRTLDFAPSRQNWYVQTSGCDLRDILVCAMYCLIPEISLVLYVHDEPRYLVPDHLTSKAVDALQQSHKASVDWMASEFGLRGLPDSFLYFDAIEVDTVWRKDANYACLTPTLQVPIPAGLTYKSKALSAGVTKG